MLSFFLCMMLDGWDKNIRVHPVGNMNLSGPVYICPVIFVELLVCLRDKRVFSCSGGLTLPVCILCTEALNLQLLFNYSLNYISSVINKINTFNKNFIDMRRSEWCDCFSGVFKELNYLSQRFPFNYIRNVTMRWSVDHAVRFHGFNSLFHPKRFSKTFLKKP